MAVFLGHMEKVEIAKMSGGKKMLGNKQSANLIMSLQIQKLCLLGKIVV